MHTARQLRLDDFVIQVDGEAATRDDVLPDWTPWDRLGVVVDRPFGALGANALIQLAITAFYDARPERRAGFPTKDVPTSQDAIYPEIYLFHVGGEHGFYAAYDFWPARKEVFLPADPRVVLDAINDRGITRLLVPDADPRPVEHEWKEPAAARDRIRSAFVYAASGIAEGGYIEIASTRGAVQANAKQVLSGTDQSGSLQSRAVPPGNLEHDPDLLRRHYASHSLRRAHEAHEHVAEARELRARLTSEGITVERYRGIGVDDALDRLVGQTLAI